MALKTALEVSLGSRLELLDCVQGLAEHVFGLTGMDPADSYWPVLAVREAVTNAMVHGNRQRSESRVDLRFELSGDSISITVSDEGAGFDPAELLDPVASENLLSANGRGIFLVRRFMDEVSFEFPDGGGTRVRLTKRLAADTGASD